MSATSDFIESKRANSKRMEQPELPLAELLAKASPLPWVACHKGCSCGQVWSKTADHPVATAQRGDWGDSTPSLRIVNAQGEPSHAGSIGAYAEPYISVLVYGRLPDDAEKHNSALIAAAVNAVPRLLALEAALETIDASCPTDNFIEAVKGILPEKDLAVQRALNAMGNIARGALNARSAA